MDFIKIPNHVAIIMDGNGRWAEKRGLKRMAGHKEGAKRIKELAIYISKQGVKYLSVFAFSTENFKRDIEEVNYLMKLFISNFTKEIITFNNHGVKVVFSGRKHPLSKSVLDAMDNVTNQTKHNENIIFNICLNYGGQSEIVDAAKKIAKKYSEGKLDLDELDETTFSKYLYQELPPIDFVIRTSGEQRTSNFMLYQSSYAEYYFPETYFPDFTSSEFDKALEKYNSRDRRFGGY